MIEFLVRLFQEDLLGFLGLMGLFLLSVGLLVVVGLAFCKREVSKDEESESVGLV